MNRIRISLLHLALGPGTLEANLARVERGISIAASQRADWVLTPELCISGYQFIDTIGTDWIEAHPDRYTRRVRELASLHRLTIVLGHVERDEAGKLYNSVFVIGPEGSIVGCHRKVNAPAERWASTAERAEPIPFNGINLGLLICSDAYPKKVAADLRAAGAQLLIAPCSWGPGLHGPEGEWEWRSAENALPLIVCNRTGRETTLTFTKAESLVIKNGQRLMAHTSERSAVLTFDWDTDEMSPLSTQFETTYLE
jgi:predicted amidohydrolase